LAEAWFTATSLAIEASHFIQSWQVELRGEAHAERWAHGISRSVLSGLAPVR
jgi:hypothetical protein